MFRAVFPGLLLQGFLLLAGAAAAQTETAATLELTDCRISSGPGMPGIAARCGVFVRPLDPADESKGTIELRVAVVPALSLEPATDPFVPVAGGPGQSTISFYAGYASAFSRIRQKRDIVLIDQRGTGDSAPLTCDIDDDVVDGKYSFEETTRLTEQCLEVLPHDPRYFTTSVAVADLEALRVALEQWLSQMMAAMEAGELPIQPLIKGLETTTVVILVTEPDTLIPYELETVRDTIITVEGPEGEQYEGRQTDRKRYAYSYPDR